MLRSQSGDSITERAREAYSQIDDPRLREVVVALIRHLHTIVKEVRLSEQEWDFAWDFLARMARFTGPDRYDFLVLADVIGICQLIEVINHERPDLAVGFALVGPFYRENAPVLGKGESIVSPDTMGERTRITGRVYDLTTGGADRRLPPWRCGRRPRTASTRTRTSPSPITTFGVSSRPASRAHTTSSP